MQTFNYRARNKAGDLIKGTIEAANKTEAAGIINSKDLVLIDMTDKNSSVDLTRLEFSKHVSSKELMIFSRQFSGMIHAGLPVGESLNTLAEDEKNKYFASAITQIAKDVEGGSELSKAMERYPKIFSNIYLSMVKVGETSGKLSETFKRLEKQLEKDYILKSQVKGAMIYPIFILVTLVSVALLAITFVFPKLIPILEEAKVELPFLTKVLIFFSNLLISFWYIILPVVIALGAFSYIFTRKGQGNKIWSRLKLYIPIAGVIIKNIYMARFLRTFSIMISGGINIVEALEITSTSIGNINYEESILNAAKAVQGGSTLADAFKENDYMTNIAKKMIKIGETTGTLDTITDDLAKFYEEEVTYQVNNLSKIIEPLLVIVMGIGVALFVSAVIMPLYDATSNIGNI